MYIPLLQLEDWQVGSQAKLTFRTGPSRPKPLELVKMTSRSRDPIVVFSSVRTTIARTSSSELPSPHTCEAYLKLLVMTNVYAYSIISDGPISLLERETVSSGVAQQYERPRKDTKGHNHCAIQEAVYC